MNWVPLVIGLLKLASSLVGWLQKRQAIQAGEDKAIAAAALQLLERTDRGKVLRERVRMLDETEENNLWEEMIKWKG